MAKRKAKTRTTKAGRKLHPGNCTVRGAAKLLGRRSGKKKGPKRKGRCTVQSAQWKLQMAKRAKARKAARKSPAKKRPARTKKPRAAKRVVDAPSIVDPMGF